MTNPVIPEAAVDAAARVAWDRNHDMPWTAAAMGWKLPYLRDATQALEAAAPHMLAEAWDEGYTTGNAHNGRRDANPYREAL